MAQELYDICKKYNIVHKLGNLTADNLTTNDKGIRILGQKLAVEDGILDFNHLERRSHCFSHAVHLAEAAFLQALSPKKTVKKNGKSNRMVPIVPAPASSPSGDVDPDEEDTEEEIAGLMVEVAEAVKELPEASEEALLLAELLLKVRGFIAKVRRSPQAKQFFKKCCRAATIEVLELLPYCKTRWGSWFGVLGHLLVLKKAVIAFINQADDSDEVPNVEKNQPKYISYRLSSEEWKFIELIHEVLKEASKVQETFSSESVPTLWLVLPVYEQFIRVWESFTQRSDMKPLVPMLNAGINNLRKYYNLSDRSPAHIVCLYLDPRVKDAYFQSAWTEEGQVEARVIMERIFDEYQAHRQPNASESSNEAPGPSSSGISQGVTGSYGFAFIENATANRRQREKRTIKDLRAELKKYLEEDLVVVPKGQPFDLLSYWKAESLRAPVLGDIARDYLAIQGSSVPCERVFSSAGLTDDKRRGSIIPQNFEAIQTCKARYRAERARRAAAVAAQREAQRKRWEEDAIEQVGS
ncbi:unnamed protein product [Somion occarium]|uniref:HAT C-terminal dimerisation domain-containing protein n=1 Tax=Somion occarium TaxID=3059160 RepID=A0ABP1E430_9APHY